VDADTLSEVLRAVRLTGAIFFDLRASSPWVEAAPPGPVIASAVLPGVQHLVSYHVVTEGACWGGLLGEPPVRLEAGDVIVFPHGDAHVLCSAPGMRKEPDVNIYNIYLRERRAGLPLSLKSGGGGPDHAHLVCGFLGCDVRPFNPLIATLPRLLIVRDRAGSSPGWISQLVRLALSESAAKRSGSEAVLARLSELMFVEVIRRHLEALPEGQTGWLAGLRDPFVGRALALLHERPSHPWTLAQLGREIGLSRSALAERFTFLIGQPPMQYLLHWRLQVAAGLLTQGSKVAAAALEVGYDSEAAFSRAFKKVVGQPPASWRDRKLERTHLEGLRRAGSRVLGESAPGERPVTATMR